ncbi:MAG: phenylalanine--tRNA ligase subunit alpha [Bacteroidota bacterium]
MSLHRAIDALREEIDAAELASADAIEAFRIRTLGRKSGAITALFGRITEVEPAERGKTGQALNALKQHAEARIDEAQAALVSTDGAEGTDLDLTLPGRVPAPVEPGSLHPLTQTLDEIKAIFRHFGFEVAEGPEIEDDWHNFTALNFPPEHPARDMQDTLFVEPPPPAGRGIVMRTHTSPAQIRVMERQAPPIRVIVPGRVYRNEAISYKSYCLFHQVEGLVVDEHATFADLKEMLHVFAQALFGDDVRMRFRPSFFPFTEPSAEVDIWWQDDNLGGGGRWMEILGCGMVDPNVLEAVDIDPERYTGYAWGMGVERLAMLKYGVDDIRLFYENDTRFLKQF